MCLREGSIRIANRTLKIKIAKYPWSKMRGMMFRSWKDVGDGLVFAFYYDEKWAMWTPFCPPMDIVSVSKDGRVVDVVHAKPMTRNPRTWRVYEPRTRCRYVLELRPGLGRLFKKGMRVSLNL